MLYCLLVREREGVSLFDYLLGYMMGNLPKDKIGLVSKEHVCEGNHYYVPILVLYFLLIKCLTFSTQLSSDNVCPLVETTFYSKVFV